MDDEYHPELADYVPTEGRSIRHPVTLKVIRVVIVIAVVALILPGVIYTLRVQVATAGAACAIVVSASAPDATPDARRPVLTLFHCRYCGKKARSRLFLPWVAIQTGSRWRSTIKVRP